MLDRPEQAQSLPCAGFQCYRSKAVAVAVLEELKVRGKQKAMAYNMIAPFWCYACGSWHIGLTNRKYPFPSR
jgi:hypothetical protein